MRIKYKSILKRQFGQDFSKKPERILKLRMATSSWSALLTVPCLLRRSSGKLEIQVESEDTLEQPMTPLKAAILQAHQGMAQLTSGKASTMHEIAEKLKMDRSYLGRTLQLANLAPDIVKLIWENRHPSTLTLDKLRKGIPESWEDQRKLFLP